MKIIIVMHRLKLPIIILLTIADLSCSRSATSKRVLDLDSSSKIIEMEDSIFKLQCFKITAVSTASIKEADSAEKEISKLQSELSKLEAENNMSPASARKNFLNFFNLDIDKFSENQHSMAKFLYGYKTCGPGWVACGFAPDTTEEMRSQRIRQVKHANLVYESYIQSKIKEHVYRVYPKMKKQHLKSFIIVCRDYLEENASMEFKRDACEIGRSDSLLNQLYSNVVDASYNPISL